MNFLKKDKRNLSVIMITFLNYLKNITLEVHV